MSPVWVQLKLPSSDGKYYDTDCATVEAMFRIIQSIPSPKAEPFKLWLARIGYERVQEIGNPELAQTRMKELYRAKGYSDDWIEKRVRGIAIRNGLTDEWKKRDVKEGDPLLHISCSSQPKYHFSLPALHSTTGQVGVELINISDTLVHGRHLECEYGKSLNLVGADAIKSRIHTIRTVQVMIDEDLA